MIRTYEIEFWTFPLRKKIVPWPIELQVVALLIYYFSCILINKNIFSNFKIISLFTIILYSKL